MNPESSLRCATLAALLAALSLLAACSKPAPPPAIAPAVTVAEGEDPLPSFVGTIWVSTTSGHARGSVLVFLPDRSVLRDSCFETFRVSKWGIISPTRIRWIEDSIPIEAEWSQPSKNELIFEPVGTGRRESYVSISVPYVCPDMSR
jgi:hypothetical protein